MSKMLIRVEKFEQVAKKMGLLLDKTTEDSFAPLYKSHITRQCWKEWQLARDLGGETIDDAHCQAKADRLVIEESKDQRTFKRVDENTFRAMQHQLVWQLLVEGKTPDEVRKVVDFMPGYDMLSLQEQTKNFPDLLGVVPTPPFLVGIHAGEDPHTDEPHISWVKAREEMEPGDKLYVVKKVKTACTDLLEHCQNCSQEVAKWPAWKRHGADVTKFQGGN